MGASPAKKLDFDSKVPTNNSSKAKPLVGLPNLDKYTVDAVEQAKSAIAPTLKPDEADEPLLRENASRFVLFPIKYHEVCLLTRTRRVNNSYLKY